MNITQIKYVLEVASSSSIREASTRLFVSQPAISTSIRELEEELGILIFERNNKGITLTDQGREFVTYAKRSRDSLPSSRITTSQKTPIKKFQGDGSHDIIPL